MGKKYILAAAFLLLAPLAARAILLAGEAEAPPF